jgi:hypothetical protein
MAGPLLSKQSTEYVPQEEQRKRNAPVPLEVDKHWKVKRVCGSTNRQGEAGGRSESESEKSPAQEEISQIACANAQITMLSHFLLNRMLFRIRESHNASI